MAYLIDSDVSVHLVERDPSLARRLLQLDAVPLMSVITRVELEAGVYRDESLIEQRRMRLDVHLARFPVLDFTDVTATIYGKIIAAAGFSRRKINDRMVAATAIEHGLSLITCNARDYRDVPDLHVIDWGDGA